MSALQSFLLNLTRPVAQVLRAVGPYAAIEILLPGGTLLAFLLWMYRRRRRGEPLRFWGQPLNSIPLPSGSVR